VTKRSGSGKKKKQVGGAPVKQVTVGPTEADLEAEIHGALKKVFHWLPPHALRHQTKFSFAFGRSIVEIDGASVSKAESRADVLVFCHDQPLAVLELKRSDIALTPADDQQGLSYARVLHPRPPLVVVTNGDAVRLIETHSGLEWQPDAPSELQLARLIDAAARVAAVDLERAVEVLLGPSSTVWVEAIRAATAAVLTDLSGRWDKPLLPFVSDFLIPRNATQEVLTALRRPGRRLVIVEGPPLAGKSNVLRSLAKETVRADDMAVLFLEADGGAGGGVFQQIANLLGDALGWPVARDQVRSWLQRLSRTKGPALVLAIDGIGAERDDVRRDVDELTSYTFGDNIRIVLAMDDTIVDALVKNSVGRNLTPIGRRAVRVEVDTLDDLEFENAAKVLWDHRMGIMNGGQTSHELRVPWIVRALGAYIVSQPRYQDTGVVAALPPLLGLDLIAHARERFADEHELRRQFHEVARAVLDDSTDRTRPIGLILESLAVFVVRRRTLQSYLDSHEIGRMIQHGMLKPRMHDSGEAILVARLPELLASEIAAFLGSELANRIRQDPMAAARWLCEPAAALPLGDLVATQAIWDAAVAGGGLPLDFIMALLNDPPRREVVHQGAKYAMHIPGTGLVDLTFRSDGSIAVGTAGHQEIIEADPDDAENIVHVAFHSWLILSHLAGQRFVAQSKDGQQQGRVDPAILLEVGSCPIVLRRPDEGKHPVLTHKIAGHGEIVCHKSGIVEPITMSILGFLGTEWRNAEEWIEEAIGRRSFPLMARIDLVLRELAVSADKGKAAWARQTIDELVAPALLDFPALH
jgi:hypothetical protein